MASANSKAHYRMVWKEELKRLEILKWSIHIDDVPKLGDIITKLERIVQRASEDVKKPDICPECATKFCAYREDCPEDVKKQ